LNHHFSSGDFNRKGEQELIHLDAGGVRRLAAATILSAVEEAMHPDPDVCYPARKWLAKEGLLWIRLLGFNPLAVRDWLKQGCPRNENSAYKDFDDLYRELLMAAESIVIALRKKKRRKRK
jgi:hypothetical protein